MDQKQDMPDTAVQGRVVVSGTAEAPLLKSLEPLSFWGGYDQATGEIIDRRHPLSGLLAAGCVVAIPFTRGSSTTTSILIEAVRAGVGPAGIITEEVDSFLALASIVADEMYGKPFPVVTLDQEAFRALPERGSVVVTADGLVRVIQAQSGGPAHVGTDSP